MGNNNPGQGQGQQGDQQQGQQKNQQGQQQGVSTDSEDLPTSGQGSEEEE